VHLRATADHGVSTLVAGQVEEQLQAGAWAGVRRFVA
jgi:hypothetical protein